MEALRKIIEDLTQEAACIQIQGRGLRSEESSNKQGESPVISGIDLMYHEKLQVIIT